MSQSQFFFLVSGLYVAPHMSHGLALGMAAVSLIVAVCFFFVEHK